MEGRLEYPGQLLFFESTGPMDLKLDCVLHLGAEGYVPLALAVQLSDNRGLALFEEALLQRWLAEGRFVEARLVVSRSRTRVALSAGESGLLLPLRTSTSSRPA